MFLLLILFFMYVFPIFFMYANVDMEMPLLSTGLIFVGVILWVVSTYLIYRFVTGAQRAMKKHKKVRDTGKPIKAEILSSTNLGLNNGYPEKRIKITFRNFAGNYIETYQNLLDSKEHEKRFEKGNYVNLVLNQDGFDPPYTNADGQYDGKIQPLGAFWVIFNVIYSIGLFIASYILYSNGIGWRFLNPMSPWITAPVTGIIIIFILVKIIPDDETIFKDYKISSAKSSKDFGELILYGQMIKGEIVRFDKTGMYVNEQPEIRFQIKFTNNYGQTEYKEVKQVISILDIPSLKTGEIDMMYLPNKSDVFVADF